MSEAILDVWEAGGRTLDDEGIELRGIEAVQDATVRSLAEMAREAVNCGASIGYDLGIEVRDTDGIVVQNIANGLSAGES